jgi:hypothetical protein
MKCFLLLLVAGCNTALLTPTPEMQAETCDPDPTLPSGATIVSCGFSPHLELIGADDAAVYAMTEGGQLFRIDKRSGAKTMLYREPSPIVDGLGEKLHLAGGRLFFQSGFSLVSIDAAAPSSPQTVLTDFSGDPVITSDAIFWLRAQREPGFEQYLDVRRSPLSGGDGEVIYNTYAAPIAADSSNLYVSTFIDGSAVYPPFAQLLKVPFSGGDVSVAVPAIDPAGRTTPSGEGLIAAGLGGVYLLKDLDAGSYPLVHYPGGDVIASMPGPHEDVPAGLPFALRLDGNDIYFLSAGQGSSWGRTVTLMQVRQQAVVPIWAALSLGVPAFDASSIYVAYQRGGLTSPIEGVVARLPR